MHEYAIFFKFLFFRGCCQNLLGTLRNVPINTHFQFSTRAGITDQARRFVQHTTDDLYCIAGYEVYPEESRADLSCAGNLIQVYCYTAEREFHILLLEADKRNDNREYYTNQHNKATQSQVVHYMPLN